MKHPSLETSLDAMSQNTTLNYYYSDGKCSVTIARIWHDGRRICYELCPDCTDGAVPGMSRAKARDHIKRIIAFAFERARLRHKTMPEFFPAIEPDTPEHFQAIPHDTTYFKFKPENHAVNA